MKPISSDKWLVLVVSLPTANATLRMRVWRALKGLGCAVLRDGVYLLPAGRGLRQMLKVYGEEVRQGGGGAYLLNVSSAPGEEREDFQILFDRSAEYAELNRKISAFQDGFAALETVAARRQLKALRRELEGIVAADYFSGSSRDRAEETLAEAEKMFFASLLPGEPSATKGAVSVRDREAYQGRLWATRKHLWVDRMACAWLIRRFIDQAARFLWLDKPEDCPAKAVGFDFDGAEFTHVGNRVTFEVLLVAFGLEQETVLRRIGAIVHFLDVGGMPVAEAMGVEMVLSGARRESGDDDAVVVEASKTFDFLFAAYAE